MQNPEKENGWLLKQADESDGSIVQYKPAIGLLLNVDKDHQEINELIQIFEIFRNNSKEFIVNQSQPLARKLSKDQHKDFSAEPGVSVGLLLLVIGRME